MSSEGRFVVLDVETQKGFSDFDRKKLRLLKVSVVCIYDSLTGQYTAFEEREMMKLEEILKKADLIIGFNIRDFDMEVLSPYLLTPVDQFPVLDLLVEFEKARGHRISLNSVAGATLNASKSGSGADALKLYAEGRMDELKQYCIDDVRITKDVYEYGIKHGHIKFQSNRDYQIYDVPVTWGGAMREMQAKKKAETAFPTSLF